MKKYLLVLAAFALFASVAFANVGDTIKVQGHNKMNMGWYGNYDTTVVFPPATNTYHKILMHYIMGCASTGCSGWDYTTIIELMQHTGRLDSTLALAPSFTVNGNTVDSINYNTVADYTTSYDTSTHQTDSVIAIQLLIRIYGDTTQPYTQTDSMYVYPANYWNYYYDTLGNRIDSVFITGSQTMYIYKTHVYTPYEVLQPYELGRVITPYGSYYNTVTWKNDYVFDITEYASLLHDTVQLRDFYSGWSNGFSVTLKFDMIEGIPPRTVHNIHPMYRGYFGAGTSTSINNQLPPKTFSLDTSEKALLFRFTPTGHGGGGLDNCAEFCSQTYDVNVNGSLYISDPVWRDDCGMNSLMHQSGTWLFDRANWCPGAKGLRKDYEIPPSMYIQGSPVTLNVAFESYTTSGSSPGYEITGELFTYGNPNHQLDMTVDDIIQPNNADAYTRFNPVCANPQVVIRNVGAQPVFSAIIRYGFVGETNYNYYWTGGLPFNGIEVVNLPNIVLNSSTPSHIFLAFVYAPNGQQDEYPWNDTAKTYADFPPVYDSTLIFFLKTNLDNHEDSWQLTDDVGNILYQNDGSNYAPSTIYRDTFHLTTGCYRFTINDAGKDGLDFNWVNGRGVGIAKILRINNAQLKLFQPDFGTQIAQSFMVGTPTLPVQSSINEIKPELMFEVYPNPNNGKLSADIVLPEPQNLTVEIYNSVGQLLNSRREDGFSSGILNFDLSRYSAGLYFVKLIAKDESITRKLILQK